jgi:hypothetical protein
MPGIRSNQPKAAFEECLAHETLRVKERAKSLPHGRERELLSRQLETSLHINEWLSSPGLKPPE